MRRDGDVGMNKPWVAWSPIGRSIGDHVCWPFRGHDAMTAAARPYVAEGLDRGERVTYVGEGDPSTLRHDLDGLPDLNEHLERGRLQLVPAATLPAWDPSVHPASELPVLAGMTSQALDAGYAGLRMFTNGTSRARDPARRAHLVGYEHLIDRFCLEHAFTRLCAFDATALGAGLLGELGCVHTLTHGELSPFQLCAARGADAALVGSVDAFSIAQLLEALRRIGVPHPGGQAVLDATDLEFIDVRALRDLDGRVADAGATLVLRSPPNFVLRLMELLGVRAVRVAPAEPPERPT
jgi:hypothetical protein